MHSEFRTFAFLIAATLILAGCGSKNGWKINVSTRTLQVDASTKDEDIRDRLLLSAPKGSTATNVLKFVVDELCPKSGTISYYAYVEAVQAGRANRINVVREDERPPTVLPPAPNWTPRYIYLVIGTYPKDGYTWKITAKWRFDNNDRFIDLVVGRDNSP